MAQSSTTYRSPLSLENFMKQVKDNNGKTILDPYSFYMTDINYYTRNNTGTTRMIDRGSAGAPDLISWMEYDTHDYWWLLCLVNLIMYGDKEIIPNMLMFLPRTTDIQAFIQQSVTARKTARIVRLGVTPSA
jgi:hypothetical protein